MKMKLIGCKMQKFATKQLFRASIRCMASITEASFQASIITVNNKEGKEGAEAVPNKVATPLPIRHRFVPMTRRTLVRKILEDTDLIQPDEHTIFQEFASSLDAATTQGFHGSLNEMKGLYDPLNPDKETVSSTNVGRKERLDNEFWLLQKLSGLLEKAHFQELSQDHIELSLKEHDSFEGVLVSVDTKQYDILRFWALGLEEGPHEPMSLFSRLANIFWVMTKKVPKAVPRYKRVVLAVRTKKQNKLMLKAFKDIPVNSLEYLLPQGRIRMSRTDKGLLVTTLGIGLTTGVLKLIASLADYSMQWTSIAGIVTALVAVKAWTAYSNKRNAYLANLTRLLYFKTVANNRALLTLIADRAEDEVLKSSLLAYIFIRAADHQRLSSAEYTTNVDMQDGITSEELCTNIENWMKEKYNMYIEYDPKEAILQLQRLGLLQRITTGKKQILTVTPLYEAVAKLPVGSDFLRESELDVEHLLPITGSEIYSAEKFEAELDSQSQIKWK